MKFKKQGFLKPKFKAKIKFKDKFNHFVGICSWHKSMPTKSTKKQTVFWNALGECYLISTSKVIRIKSRDLILRIKL